MKISNEERREMAARLRESREFISSLPKTAATAAIVKNTFDTFERILECLDYEHGNVFDYIAELIDRPTCRNVYDESKCGACENGFECSECGNVVEDGEGWLVNGTFNYCSECGREVVE